MRDKEESQTEQERRWSELLANYPLSLHEMLDNVLLGMVRSGYPGSNALRSAIAKFEADAGLRRKRNAWEKAWHCYHDAIGDNGQKIVEAFEETRPGVSAVENAVNLQSLARLLRLLGRADLASRFINEWVVQRAGEESSYAKVDTGWLAVLCLELDGRTIAQGRV